jgi:hypothetical protein
MVQQIATRDMQPVMNCKSELAPRGKTAIVM